MTLDDGTKVTSSNFQQFVEQKGYDYWKTNIGSDYFALIPNTTFSELVIVKADYPIVSKAISYANYMSCVDDLCSSFKVSTSSDSINFQSEYKTSLSISGQFNFTNCFSTFSMKAYNSETFLFENNFSDVDYYFYITFDIPSGSTLVVKNSEGEVMTSVNNVYSLEVGTYTYTLTKSTYKTLECSFEVTKDETIVLELESSLELSTYKNIFNSFIGYLGNVISIIFDLNNPLFLILSGIFILLAVFVLILRLLKGVF